jgi:hypothetical protein
MEHMMETNNEGRRKKLLEVNRKLRDETEIIRRIIQF